MSCTVMYQPYAMSYSSSSCERTNSSLDKAPSPQDSLTSDTSSYNSPGPIITLGPGNGSSTGGPGSVGSGSTPIHNSSLSLSVSASSSASRRPLSPSSIPLPPSSHNINSLRTSSSSRPGTSSSARLEDAQHESLLRYGDGGTISPVPSTSQHLHQHHHHHHNSNQRTSTSSQSNRSNNNSASSQNQRAQYVSANCVVFVHYNGDVSRVVDEHFSRALSASYVTDKPLSKSLPMSTRNFPPSFWNSNYQPSKPLASYGADFYGAAVDYGTPLAGLAHHHQGDPWHYPLPPPHQSYHSRPAEIPYPPMPSTSRFNAAQYGSFLLAGAAASSGAGRFTGVMPGSSQCGMKGSEPSSWAGGRYHPHHHHHHHHESLSDLHLADYSAAAAAHYSNMTAGLESSAQDSTSKDLYWF